MKLEQNIPLPSKPKVVEETETKGVYEIESLYPGYGQTIGNTLRRVMLSSISGAAITKVNIEKAEHEFTSIKGIKEDTLEIILNMKRIHFKLDSPESQVVTINKKGLGPITSADIQCPTQVTVANKDQHIAEITDKNTTFNAKLTIEHGIGFVSREDRNDGKAEIGTIILDSTFSPIRHVNYEIEQMRVGNRVDFNRLRVTIETNGTISPQEVMKKAISVMITQLQSISGFVEDSDEDEVTMSDEDIAKERGSIEELEVSPRIIKSLKDAGIKTIEEITKMGEKNLKEVKGLGNQAIVDIKEGLKDRGIELNE